MPWGKLQSVWEERHFSRDHHGIHDKKKVKKEPEKEGLLVWNEGWRKEEP